MPIATMSPTPSAPNAAGHEATAVRMAESATNTTANGATIVSRIAAPSPTP